MYLSVFKTIIAVERVLYSAAPLITHNNLHILLLRLSTLIA
jgi:hypothetical protein